MFLSQIVAMYVQENKPSNDVRFGCSRLCHYVRCVHFEGSMLQGRCQCLLGLLELSIIAASCLLAKGLPKMICADSGSKR